MLFSRQGLSVCLGGVILLSALALSAQERRPQRRPRPAQNASVNANELVKKMVTTYQKAKTIQETTEAEVTAFEGRKLVQTATIKFKRPNLIFIKSQDPQLGSLEMYSNGRFVTVWSGKENIFTKRSAPTTLTATIQEMERAVQELMGQAAGQIINPISFLTAKGMPNEAKSFRYGGIQSLAGRKMHMVAAPADSKWVRLFRPGRKWKPERSEVAFWIDPKTNLLSKGYARVAWSSVVQADRALAPQTVRSGWAIEERHFDTTLNAEIPDSVFQFTPPAGSKEIFQRGR